VAEADITTGLATSFATVIAVKHVVAFTCLQVANAVATTAF